jgi:SMI1 / KNR4 family (SUKH-1)
MIPPMNDQDRYDDLIARVAARAGERCAPLPSPVSPQALAAAEKTLGFALHPLLARLYREIADGGFGPEYRLFALDGTAPGGAAADDTGGGPLVAAYLAHRAGNPQDAGWFWPEGVVPFLTWGCGMLACVDCRSPEGTVLLFEPNPVDGDWAEAWFLDADSLAEWLETSLAGRGWYTDPDADDDWGDPADGVAEEDLQPVDLRRWAGQARARAGDGRLAAAGA